MKQYYIKGLVFLIIIVSLITGCTNNTAPIIIDYLNCKEILIEENNQNNNIQNEIMTEIYKIEKPENVTYNAFCVYDSILYYAKDYKNLFENHTGEKETIKFSDEYQTQIRAYDLKNNTDKLLYQYNEEMCVSVLDMQCNVKELIWVDTAIDGWQIHMITMSEADNSIKESFLTHQTYGSKFWMITLTISENGFYWYDTQNDESSIDLYQYDFETEEITVIDTDVYIYSPYESVVIKDNHITYTKKLENEEQGIYRYNIITKDKQEYISNIGVQEVISNDDFIIGEPQTNYLKKELLVYDIKKMEAFMIKAPHIHTTALVNNKLWFSDSDSNNITIFDLETQEHNAFSSDDVKAGYLYKMFDDSFYFNNSSDNEEFQVIAIK